jgi:O-succinylbenzoate synthase
VASPAPARIDAVELRLLRLPLAEPFETSFGRVESRLIFLVRLFAEGTFGWGEVVAMESPSYSYETVGTARHVIRDYLAPALLDGPLKSLADLAGRFGAVRGHPMARAGLELAYVDLVARLRGESLARVLGGSFDQVAVGVSLGIQAAIPALLERVDRHLALGYQRIKLKIKPGWDLDVVGEVRRLHPDILLSVDANAAYTLEDLEHLRRLDEHGLLMIEQPLDFDDLVDHASLQKELKTPLCLDESLNSLRRTRQALALRSCRIVNMKVGRVGGYSQALPIHELCHERGVPVWCGGMLESGVGRAHNIALASLRGFTLPGDISASRRYFARDIIQPPVEVGADGMVRVPQLPGLGFEVDMPYVEERTEAVERLAR